MNISLGSDHAGFSHKEFIKGYLWWLGHDIFDRGAYSTESVDYPDVAHIVCQDIISEHSEYGILLCGTANGMVITANKYKDVRAWLAWNPEIARLVREHNNANILCIPARYTDEDQVRDIVQAFLGARFEWWRHERRIEKIVKSTL